MKIDRRLNIVIPVENEDGSVFYAYAEPVGEAVFTANFRIFSKAFSIMMSEGGQATGPRLAAMYLQLAADSTDETGEAYKTLMNEIRRLTNLVILVDGKWQTIPYDDAVRRKFIGSEDVKAVEGCCAFFTLLWHMLKREQATALLFAATLMFDAQTSSLSLTDWMNSLPTSTSEDPTDKKGEPSSIPS